MPTCFVMQPFDGGKYDKRYEEILKSAIVAAGLEPYRVDKDPSVSIPIAEIEQGIRDAALCLAEITEDNPNVWFELGFAIACKKEVVLICSQDRTTKFPFDVHHRTIIKYANGSPSDFKTLKSAITAKLVAYSKKLESVTESISEIKQVTTSNGLAQHEIVALAVITASIEHPGDTCWAGAIKRDMETAGYTTAAAAIALRSLEKHGYVSGKEAYDDASDRSYYVYSVTEKGWDWVLANQHRFSLNLAPVPTKDADPVEF